MRFSGRGIAPGRSEGVGLVDSRPMSFVGGVDRESGLVVDPASDLKGETVEGRVLVFPHGKGSTVGSYVLYGLAKRGHGPVAVVNERAEAIVATGAILGGIPLVDGVPVSVLRTGDRVTVDGDAGVVDVPTLIERRVVTAILRNRGRILMVRRSQRVTTFPGAWSGVSGYIEGSESPLTRARQEIKEETGIRSARLVARGPIVMTRHHDDVFAVHPFLFDCLDRKVVLDWENEDARWILPEHLSEYPVVPRLADVVASVLGTPTPSGPAPRRPPVQGGGADAHRASTGSRKTGGRRRSSQPGRARTGRGEAR